MEFLGIPPDLISYVLQDLSHVDLLRCSMSNRFLHSLVMECEGAWKKLFEASFGNAVVSSHGTNCRAGFRTHWVTAMRKYRLKKKLKSEKLAASIQVLDLWSRLHGRTCWFD